MAVNPSTPERSVLTAARGGSEAAFRDLVESRRASLQAHCYSMLASAHDAEDAVQETMLRAWRGLPEFDGRSATRTWLHAIATNVCLDAIRRRARRVLPVDVAPASAKGVEDSDDPLDTAVWIDPFPDEQLGLGGGHAAPEARYEQREAVELAFIAALQILPARQRAVLILRDVLGFSAVETATALDATTAAVNSALQRARRSVSERLPERSQQASLRVLGDARVRSLVDAFVDAFERGEVDSILALLADDATFAMPPYPTWRRGREAIAESWLMPGGPPPWLRYAPARANGQLALGTYRIAADGKSFFAVALDVLAIRDDGLITEVVAFRTPEVFPAFGLPLELAR